MSSLKDVLGRTTRVPLRVHPCLWGDAHLAALRVEGFDRTLPLPDVIGPLVEKADSFNLNCNRRKRLCDTSQRWPRSDLPRLLRIIDELGGEYYAGPEGNIACLLQSWLNIIRKDLSRLKLSRSEDFAQSFFSGDLPIRFGSEVVDVSCNTILQGYPVYEESPISFPIVGVWARTKDHYSLRRRDRDVPLLEELRHDQKRRRYSSKNAELVAVFIAMAQKQAEALRKDRFDNTDAADNDRLHVFRPMILVVSGVTVQFVRARISLAYLEALSDLSKPLKETLVIEQTIPLKLLKRNVLWQRKAQWKVIELISLAVTALVDDYISLLPLFEKRKPLAPGEARESLTFKMLVESVPWTDVSSNCDGVFVRERKYTRKRQTKTVGRLPQNNFGVYFTTGDPTVTLHHQTDREANEDDGRRPPMQSNGTT